MSLKDRLFGKKKVEEIKLVGVRPEILDMVQNPARPRQMIPEDELPQVQEAQFSIFEEPKVVKAKEIAKIIEKEVSYTAPDVAPRIATKEPRVSIWSRFKKKEPELPPVPVNPSADLPVKKVEPWVEPEPEPEGKTVLEAIKEKKRKKQARAEARAESKTEAPRLQLSFEDAVEKYEMERLSTHKGKEIAPAKPAGPPARFTRAEINKFLVIKIMPSFVRSILANRNNVKFLVYCGIFQLEFIKVVPSREEGRKFMADLKEALDFDSVMEVFPRRNGVEVIAIYSRKHTDLRGKYSGTPLRPRLLERS